MAKIKSSVRAYFINTETSADPTWAKLGKGVKSLSVDMGPQTTTETYIDEDAATTSVDSYQPSAGIDMTAWDETNAPAYAYVNGLAEDMAVGSDAETEILEVDLNTASPYTAWLHNAVVAINSRGLTGGEAQTLSATAYFNGEATEGTVVITDGAPVFTETA